MLQAYVLNVSSVSDVCCSKCFMLQVFYEQTRKAGAGSPHMHDMERVQAVPTWAQEAKQTRGSTHVYAHGKRNGAGGPRQSRVRAGVQQVRAFVRALVSRMMYSIIKLWSFQGWGLDFIWQIRSPCSKGHHFVLVVTNYFTKYTEKASLKNMMHNCIYY
jgi:hypothetical protein